MNKRVEGKVNMVVGTVKEKLGDLTGNKDLKRDGQVQKLKGATQEAVGTATLAAKGVAKTLTDKAQSIAGQHMKQADKQADAQLDQTLKDLTNLAKAATAKVTEVATQMTQAAVKAADETLKPPKKR